MAKKEKGRIINIIGDSITWGYRPIIAVRIKKRYAKLLEEKEDVKKVRNYGINTSTLAYSKKAFKPMIKRYQHMRKKADIVILFGGTNDFGRDDFGIELGKLGEVDIHTIYGALNHIVSGLKEMYPTSRIILATPLPRAIKEEGSNLLFATNRVNRRGFTLLDVRKAIIDTAKRYQVELLDLYEKCNIKTPEEIKKIMPDGLHPTTEYQEKLAEMFWEKIQEK